MAGQTAVHLCSSCRAGNSQLGNTGIWIGHGAAQCRVSCALTVGTTCWQECLVEQEGHSRSVYAVAFQRDGALAASAGLDAVGAVLIPFSAVLHKLYASSSTFVKLRTCTRLCSH